MKILFQYPTRRRHVCFNTLDIYYSKLDRPDLAEFHLSCDTEDEKMNNDEVRGIVAGYKNASITYTPNPERSGSRPGNVIPHKNWDILVVTCDDAIPQVKGFDTIIRNAMQRCYPDTDGVLHFNDGHHGDYINTHPILGRKYYERFGYISYPGYLMLYGDTELTTVSKLLKRVTYFPQCIVEHQHPAWGFKVDDELYQFKNQFYGKDGELFKERSARNFDLKV